jgi:hypothetical protein
MYALQPSASSAFPYSIFALRLSLNGGQSPPAPISRALRSASIAPPEHFIGTDIFNDNML